MSHVTENVARHIRERGINLSRMARDTNIPYSALYSSVGENGRDRDLRDDELLAVCRFIGVNPMEFANNGERNEGRENNGQG